SAIFKVSAQTSGTKVITAQDTEGNLATTTFFIIPFNISVSPSSGLAGIPVTIIGSGFCDLKSVTISFGTHQTITTTQSSNNGTFSATFIVDTQTPGTKVITAKDSEGNLATTVFILLPPTFLKILPSYNLIAKNQEFDVEVRIEDVRNLAAVQTYLLFNPNVLEVIQLSSGSFPSGAVVSTNTTPGQVYYFAGLFTGSATGSGLLCSIRFRGKEGGSSTLAFKDNTALRDAGNSPIPFNKCEGLYYVASSLSVSPENRTILSGNSQSYSALAICETGSVNVTGSSTFTASGGGSFTTNTFEAHYIGTYTIQASFLGLIGTTNVYITPGTPTTLLYVSGNNQTANCQETLANPFVVKVEDAYHNPCPDVLVNFAVISSPVGADGYSLSTTTTRTNINGTASSYLTLGDEPPGSWTVRASSGSLSSFDFTAWSLRRFGNIAGICLIDLGSEGQRTASITVTLIETGATITTNLSSYFIFTNIPAGTYTLNFSFQGATPATRTAVITQTQFNDTTNIGTITLIAGDPNGDGQINMLDWPYLADSLGSDIGSSTYSPACDFNSDGKIDIDDFMIFRLNFGEQQQGGRGGRAKTKTRDRAIALKFEPNSINDAKIGDLITMNILISGSKDSYGGEVHLSFNSDVLEAISMTKGDWIGEGACELINRIDNSFGKIDLALGALKPIQESSGLFAKVSFRVKAEGESLVKFDFDTEANRRTLFIEKDQTVPEIIPDEGKIEVIPSISILLQSYPNPSSDSCYIPFKLSEDADVIVEVYNILGQKVRTIEAGYKKAGSYIKQDKALFYDLRNDKGDKLSQGLYFIKLKAGKYSGRQRLVIQR
ncbi:T9SS type A sorting domain-containing protein, partial [bacterium]|nr:T9SS type A sorting domain-containing protein [bacterium]